MSLIKNGYQKKRIGHSSVAAKLKAACASPKKN